MDKPELNSRASGNRRPSAAFQRRKVKAAAMPDKQPPPDTRPNRLPAIAVPSRYANDDDPQLVAAVAQANQRFDEFLEALADRKPDDTFAVKAPFRDDFGKEYMWLTVSRVDDDTIYGQLGNDPACVKSVKRGQPVKVPRKMLNDWLYTRGDQMHGGFTVAVSDQKPKRRPDTAK